MLGRRWWWWVVVLQYGTYDGGLQSAATVLHFTDTVAFSLVRKNPLQNF
jgi:hypothetical protein